MLTTSCYIHQHVLGRSMIHRVIQVILDDYLPNFVGVAAFEMGKLIIGHDFAQM